MMKNVFLFLSLILFVGQLNAQDISVKVELDRDSIGYEEGISVTFTIENTKDFKFEAPDFSAFEGAVRSGTQSSMSMVNGKVTQSTGYTYSIKHFGKGNYNIESATFIVDGIEYFTEVKEIVVTEKAIMPNKKKSNPYSFFNDRRPISPFGMPDNRQQPKSKDKKKKKDGKKKKKVYRI